MEYDKGMTCISAKSVHVLAYIFGTAIVRFLSCMFRLICKIKVNIKFDKFNMFS